MIIKHSSAKIDSIYIDKKSAKKDMEKKAGPQEKEPKEDIEKKTNGKSM